MTPPVTPPGPLEKSRRATMQWLLGFMDHLDRLGYVAAGFSLLALGCLLYTSIECIGRTSIGSHLTMK